MPWVILGSAEGRLLDLFAAHCEVFQALDQCFGLELFITLVKRLQARCQHIKTLKQNIHGVPKHTLFVFDCIKYVFQCMCQGLHLVPICRTGNPLQGVQTDEALAQEFRALRILFKRKQAPDSSTPDAAWIQRGKLLDIF